MKKIIKKIAVITGWVFLTAFLAVTMAFSSRETAGVKCREIRVKYAGNPTIRLAENDLIRKVRATDPNIIGRKLNDIDTEAIESRIEKESTILKADVWKKVVRDSSGFKGVIALKVTHRTPVLRVISSGENYYMDKDGHKIPVSFRYAAHVPVITGNVTTEQAREELLPFVDFISGDKFWKAQIKQIHVNGGGELLLTTLVGNQLIEFGTPDNMEEKFRNLRAFYDQVLIRNYWNKYNRIIVKFRNQVIAKRKK